MQINRRQFFKISASSMAGTSLATLGFMPGNVLAEVRQYKTLRSKETRSTCPYCSVGCGVLLYSRTDGSGNVKDVIFHAEGDPDHPISQGTLCPKGAGVVDFINSNNRLRYPMVRESKSAEWKQISWEEAIDRIARLMKDDRDAHFIPRENGVTVNRYTTTGMLACTSTSNEAGILTQKFVRALGMVGVDHVARI